MADIILGATETTGDAIQIGASRGGWWQIEVKDYSVQVTIEIEYIDESGWVEIFNFTDNGAKTFLACLLYTSPSPRDRQKSRMPSSA